MEGSRCSSQRRKGMSYNCPVNLTDRHQDRLRSTRRHDDFVHLHEAARHTAHCFETLGVCIDTVSALQQELLEACAPQNEQNKNGNGAIKQLHKQMGAQLRMMRNLHARSQSNRDRLQSEIALVRVIYLQKRHTADETTGVQYDRSAGQPYDDRARQRGKIR